VARSADLEEHLQELVGRPGEVLFPPAPAKIKEQKPRTGKGRGSKVVSLEMETFRKSLNKRRVDLDLDRKGSIKLLAVELSTRIGRKVSESSVSMALSGYRHGAPSHALLKHLSSILDEKEAASWTPLT
jgi:hypothetical protein